MLLQKVNKPFCLLMDFKEKCVDCDIPDLTISSMEEGGVIYQVVNCKCENPDWKDIAYKCPKEADDE